ncbi:unnamed protein product [Owenia fusiformis]|uniref:Uncharacterized protein n=1 Tax=Owenia fusiformis TaxID=6347 RepID=A0A8J1U2T6_OWEFU|nr:unnamed protein product [Owenia fusiformis]
MGVVESTIKDSSALHSALLKHGSELRQIAIISHEHFLSIVKGLNDLTTAFTDNNGKQLHFQVKKDTDSTIFWKGTVRIRCIKINTVTKMRESSRLLNLKQFLRLYREIMSQATTYSIGLQGQGASQPDLCASMILTEVDCAPTVDSECPICMEHKADVVLSCTHSYCEQCISQWSADHENCPICRAKVTTNDESWELTEKPDASEISEMTPEVKGYLIGLADKSGEPNNEDASVGHCHSPQDDKQDKESFQGTL